MPLLLLLVSVPAPAHQHQAPELSWRFVTGGKILHKPALDHRRVVYVASEDRYLYALLPDGRLKWGFNLGSKPTTSPLVDYTGTVYVGTAAGDLYAVAPNGTLRWRFPGGSGACLNPSLGRDGTIYLPTQGGVLYALAFTGREVWRFQLKARISSGLSLDSGGTLYFGTTDRRLHALKPTGAKKWEILLGGTAGTPAIGGDGTVYVNAFGIQAISPDGKLLWSYAIPARTADPVIGAGGIIISGAQNARLYAIDPQGRKLWDLDLGEAIESPAAVAEDRTILVGTAENHLHAVSPQGELLWSFAAKRSVRIPTLDPEGTLYVGSDDWILYALQGEHGGPGDSSWPLYLHDHQHTGRAKALENLYGPVFQILKEQARAEAVELKMAALDDIERYLLRQDYLGVHVLPLEGLLGYLATEGLTRREYRRGRVSNNHPAVRRRASRLLGLLATEGAREILLEVLHREPEPSLKSSAADALGRIGSDSRGETIQGLAWELSQGVGRKDGSWAAFLMVALDALGRIAEHRARRNAEHSTQHLAEVYADQTEIEVKKVIVRVAAGEYPRRIKQYALTVLRSLDKGKLPASPVYRSFGSE